MNKRESSNSISWQNIHNKEFYNHIEMLPFTKKAGLDGNFDLERISKYIEHAGSICELGCGYGRVLSWLLNKKNFKGPVIAVEQSSTQIALASEVIRKHSNVTLIQGDYSNVNLSQKVDLLLFMFSGLCDWNPFEYSRLFSHLASQLTANGLLVIDFTPPDSNISTSAEKSNSANAFHIDIGRGVKWQTILPQISEIEFHAARSSFALQGIDNYETYTQRKRTILIFRKHF